MSLRTTLFAGCVLSGGLLLSAGCVQFAMTLIDERRLDVVVTTESGTPVAGAEINLYQNIRDWAHGDEETLALGPNLTDEKGVARLMVPKYSPVIVKVRLPNGTQIRSAQPWPDSGHTLHVVALPVVSARSE